MGKLHELIAVESAVTGKMNAILEETIKTFDRGDLFQRQTITKKFFADEDQKLNTSETKDLTTSVAERLKYTAKAVTRFFDFALQRDLANRDAKSDLVVGDTIIAKDVPATTLLMLEKQLVEVRKAFVKAPTLPAGIPVDWDENERLFVTRDPVVTFQTKRTSRAVVLYEATQHHPAQVKEIPEDTNVARIEKTSAFAMLTSGQKADILERIDNLLLATKKARQKANLATVPDSGTFGQDIMSFILGNVGSNQKPE